MTQARTRTLFSAILRACGLSLQEAADYLGVRRDTVASWSSGRRTPPAGALDDLRELTQRIDRAALEAVEAWKRSGRPREVEIGIATDDHEARALGWSSAGVHLAVIARLWALLPDDVAVVTNHRGNATSRTS